MKEQIWQEAYDKLKQENQEYFEEVIELKNELKSFEQRLNYNNLIKLEKENKKMRESFKEIEILSKKQIYGCVYGQDGIFNCRLNHNQCDKCLAEEVIKIVNIALNKTSL